MPLAKTTLASPLGVNDNSMVVASTLNITGGRLAEIDQETVQVVQGYNGATPAVPILRGREGSATSAHKSGANVTHGTAADFASPAPQTMVTYAVQRAKVVVSVSASSVLVLPAGGTDSDVILNGGTPITLTVPPPTPDMDTTRLTIYGNAVAAAHVVIFTGGLGAVGAGYTTVTNNASGPTAIMVVAANGIWVPFTAGGLSGTVTKVVAGIA